METKVAMTDRVCALVLAALLLQLGAGCKATPKKSPTRVGYVSDGNVSAQRLQAPASESYGTDPTTTYSGSSPAKDNPVPQYPAALLSDRLPPVGVTARVIVDVSGAVTSATVAEGDSIPHAFAAAVLAAVRSWRFEPLKRMSEGKVEALPFSQQYRFVFTQVNGRPVVSSGHAPSR
jgi:TonB family protein